MKNFTIHNKLRALATLGALLACLTAPGIALASDCAAAPSRVAEHLANRALNHCPRANAGADRVVIPDQSTQLDAAASSDTDGQQLSFDWRLLSAPNGSGAAVEDRHALRTQFTPDLLGDYVFELAVTDAAGATSVDTVRFSTADAAPVADAGPDVTAAVGTHVDLRSTRSYDLEGAPLKYRWQLIAQPAGSATRIDGINDASASVYLDVAGDYVVELMVSDGKFDSIADTVRLSTVNSAPVADAGRARTLAPDSTLQLDGARSRDVDGDALSYHWSVLAAPAGVDLQFADPNQVTPTLRLQDEGLYLFQLMVADGVYLSAPETVLVEVDTRRLQDVNLHDFLQLTQRGGGDDTDGDGVLDPLDNCVLIANPNQRDTDGDGLGNYCDADLNQDGIVNPIDLGIFRTRFFTNDPDADFNGDGIVNPADLGILRSRFFLPPGPAGTTIWVSLVDGDWANRLNWEPQTVPAAGTMALIDVGPAVTVTASSDTIVVKDLTNNEDLVLSGGSFEATGALENGGTITVTTSTINNTQIVPSLAGSGTLTANASTHTWSNLVLGVDTTLSNGAIVNMSNGLEINATTTIDAPTSPTGFQFATQSLSGTGTVVLNGVGNSVISEPRLFPLNSTTLTIDSGLTIRGGKGTIGQAFANLVMNADIIADVSSEPILLAGSLWSGTGSLTASNGGEIQFSGNFDNQGGTLTVDGATGTVRMLINNALRNTTINATGGTDIQVNAGATTLENVVLNSDLTLANAASISVFSGLTLNGTATINAPSSPTGLVFANTQTLTGTGTIMINGVGNSVVSEPRLFPGNSTVLTIDSGITVRGGKGTVGQAFAELVFLGTLIADQPGEELVIGGSTWSSNSSLQAINDGEIRLFGNFDNAADSLALDAADGVVSVSINTAMRHATLNGTAGTTLNFPAGATTLQDMNLNLDTAHVNGALTTVSDGLTLNGNALIDAPSSPTGMVFANTQTLDGTATITLDGTGNSVVTEPRLFPGNSTTLTIGANVTIRGGNATVGQSFASLVFEGTLDANVNGQTLQLGGSQWSANQTLRAQNGGRVHLFGTHDNSGASFALDAAGGEARLLINTVLRDTVVNGTAGTTLIFSSGATTLDGVTITADTTHENAALTNVSNSLTINGTATIEAPSSTTGLTFSGSQSLLGNLTVVFNSAGNSVISEPRLFPANSTTLTIASTVTIEGGKATIGNAFATLVFNGVLDANVAGQALRILGTNWSGTGTLAAHNGGAIEIGGSLDNGGQTLALDTTGGTADLLVNATLRNVTVSGSAGTNLTVSSGASTFQNVFFNADMTLVNGALVSVSNGLTLNGTATINAPSSATGFQFTNSQTLGGSGTVVLNGVGNAVISEPRLFPGNSTVLTIGPNMAISGGQGTIGQSFASVIIQGSVSADLGTLVLAGTVTQNGLVEALAGHSISLPNTLNVGAGASFHAAPGSTIDVAATMTLLSDTIVSLDVDALGAAGTGRLTANTLNMDGTLNVSAVNGFTPNLGDAFNLTASTTNSGTFATVNSSGLGGGQSFVVTYPVGDAVATVN